LTKTAFTCVGFEPREAGLIVNCGNCKNWDGACLARDMLDELYEESAKFKAYDRQMRTNRGARIE